MLFLLLYLVNFTSAVTTIVFVISIIAVLVLVTHFRQWEALIYITLKIPCSTISHGWSCKKYHFKNHYYHFRDQQHGFKCTKQHKSDWNNGTEKCVNKPSYSILMVHPFQIPPH